MKRVLMLPSDWAMGEELDALVLHELAHLRRGDVGTNSVVRVIQTVLWFHPAIWRLVRAAVSAREEACDVESVAHSGSALVLARALVKLEERRQSPLGDRLALVGATGQLRWLAKCLWSSIRAA
jgi:beta-lactamase regulating signal transducer with metallopeptidase domain